MTERRSARARKLMAVAERAAALPRPLLVALDVDGTLAPIVDDPAAARVPPGTQALLRALTVRRGVRVALVTGRDAAQLKDMIRVPGVYRAFSHGRHLVAPGERVKKPRERPVDRERLDAFADWAKRELVPKGAEVELKLGARAVHVRRIAARAPKRAKKLLALARVEARNLGLHPRDGRHVLEAEVARGDKGDALEAIRKTTRARGVLYAGDDLTDYPAIRRAERLGGIGVFVRSPDRPRAPRGTTLSLRDTAEMQAFLAELVEAL